MLPVTGKADRHTAEFKTALGRVVVQDDDGNTVVTKLGRNDVIDWQVTCHGWTPQQVRERVLSHGLDEIGGAM